MNCSLFNPTPSLASMVVNHFRMRPSIVTYNLSGMGCSAGLIAVGLAQELLQARASLQPQPAVAAVRESCIDGFRHACCSSALLLSTLPAAAAPRKPCGDASEPA